jgi:VanZ family protein
MRTGAPLAWLLVAAWSALVWSLGSDAFSHGTTSRILGPLLAWLLPGASPDLVATLVFAIRKSMHVLEYGVLALLAVRAVSLTWSLSPLRAAVASLALVALLASADELRQSGSQVRTGSGADVVLDATAGGLALACLFALPARLRRRLAPPADVPE